jgi:hypothetical protein
MDEEIERLVISVRADTAAFARDVSTMRGALEGPLVSGAGRAGRMIDASLARALATGKTGFDDLKKIALAAMNDIASASLRALFRPAGGGSFGAGLLSGLSSLVAGLVGSPGRRPEGPCRAAGPTWSARMGPSSSSLRRAGVSSGLAEAVAT